jgi:FSR family fosmidomycin resistance protein-like MFS transporter
VVIGPLLLSAFAVAGWSWRIPFALVALLALVGLMICWRAFSHSALPAQLDPRETFRESLTQVARAVRRKEVLRWLALLQCAETMMGFFFGYVSLYLVDVAGMPPAAAGLGVAILTGAGLVSDGLIIPLLERVPGLVMLRYSAAVVLVIFVAFLLAPLLSWKLVLLGLLGFCNAGWYPILKAQIYSSMPGQSGAALSLHSISALIGSIIPLLIGALAQRFGLGAAIWLLLFGPVALLIGLPPRQDQWAVVKS